MRFGTPEKYKMALQIAGALSYIILNNLDRVSLNAMKENSLIKGKGVTGKRAFPFLLEELSQMEFAGATTLSQAILSRPVQRGGTSIIISDFLDASGIEDAIKYLTYRKQTIVLIQILAPEEERIDYEGTLHLVDMETGQKVKITMTNAAIREYGKRLETWKGDLKKTGNEVWRFLCVSALRRIPAGSDAAWAKWRDGGKIEDSGETGELEQKIENSGETDGI